MNKKKIIIILIGVLVAIALVVGGILLFTNKKEEEKPSADALKFKEEYESLNETVREGTESTYSAITIPEFNPIKYVSVKEVIDLLESDAAIIYAGANWCPWCRGAVSPLLDVVKNYNVKTLYYLNLDNDKSLFEVQNKKAVQTREGTEDYYELLEKLDKYLEEYTLTQNKKTYKTGEKRIYQPTIITVKDGKIVSVDNTTIELDKDQTAYDKITEKQYEFYYDHFEKLVKEVYGNGCDTDKEEGCD